MNQILETKGLLDKKSFNKSDPLYKKNTNYKFYKVQFIVSCLIAFSFIIVFAIRIFNINKNEKLSERLLNMYTVSTLYSNSTDYSTQLLESSNNDLSSSNSNPFVIGMITIEKINLNYPILSESNKDLLDISICRFAGPMPNEMRKSLHCRA